MRTDRTLIPLLVVSSMVATATSASSRYSVQQLDTPAPFVGFYTARLTDDELVPGYARQLSTPEVQAVEWSAATGSIASLTDGTLPYSIAQASTSAGALVGLAILNGDDDAVPTVFYGTTVHILPLPGRFGAANVASADTIVGITTEQQVAVWKNEHLLGLITNLPGVSITPFDINSSGRYVGAYTSFGFGGGFVGEGLDAHELILAGFAQPHAYGINDANTIAGIFLPDGNARVGYVAHDDGHGNYTATALSPLPGQVESPVWAINNNGDMVGLSTPSANSFDETATVYFAGSTTPVDMNSLIDPIPGVKLVRGIDINNLGQILVEGTSPQGFRYFVLTPVPEPATLNTSTACALVTGIIRRRRRRARLAGSSSAQPTP